MQETKDAGLIPGLGKSLGGGHGNLHQCSCLENLTDRGASWATVTLAKPPLSCGFWSQPFLDSGFCTLFIGLPICLHFICFFYVSIVVVPILKARHFPCNVSGWPKNFGFFYRKTWTNLFGQPNTSNKVKVTLAIPVKNFPSQKQPLWTV